MAMSTTSVYSLQSPKTAGMSIRNGRLPAYPAATGIRETILARPTLSPILSPDVCHQFSERYGVSFGVSGKKFRIRPTKPLTLLPDHLPQSQFGAMLEPHVTFEPST